MGGQYAYEDAVDVIHTLCYTSTAEELTGEAAATRITHRFGDRKAHMTKADGTSSCSRRLFGRSMDS